MSPSGVGRGGGEGGAGRGLLQWAGLVRVPQSLIGSGAGGGRAGAQA